MALYMVYLKTSKLIEGDDEDDVTRQIYREIEDLALNQVELDIVEVPDFR